MGEKENPDSDSVQLIFFFRKYGRQNKESGDQEKRQKA